MMTLIKTFFLFVVGLSPLLLFSQNTISLIDLYKAVEIGNPLSKIPSGMDSIYQLKRKNLEQNYLPKLDLNASATWQSEVTSLDINVPIPGFSIPKADKDQYKVALDVTQLIWDGGSTNAKKEMELQNNILDKSRVDVEVYSVKDRITSLYFSLLMLKVTENQLNLMCTDLDKREQELESSVKVGYILNSTLDGIKAEKLKLLQSIDAIPAQRKSLISSLKSLTGVVINEEDNFIIPNPDSLASLSCLRPELKGFSYQQNVLDASSNLIARKRYPILAGFVSAGYGKPGLNMLSNNWNTYYMFGAKLSWNIWDWNSVRKEKQQLKIQEHIVDYRKQTYLDAYQAQIEGIISEIQKLNSQLSKDEVIVKLLHQVTEQSASSLKNGSTTSAVYLADFNSESRAKLDLELRKIRLSQQRVMLYNISGNELVNK